MGQSLSEFIATNLGYRTLEKIESRLIKKYGLSLSQAHYDLDKLDDVLHEFFGAGGNGLLRRYLESLSQSSLVDAN